MLRRISFGVLFLATVWMWPAQAIENQPVEPAVSAEALSARPDIAPLTASGPDSMLELILEGRQDPLFTPEPREMDGQVLCTSCEVKCELAEIQCAASCIGCVESFGCSCEPDGGSELICYLSDFCFCRFCSP